MKLLECSLTPLLQRSQSQSRVAEVASSRPYTQVKEEQIQLAQGRASFHTRSRNTVAKSPQPFRRGQSETRVLPTNTNIISNNNNTNLTNNTANNSSRVNLNAISQELLPSLTESQKAGLVELLLGQLPPGVGDKIVADRMDKMPDTRLCSAVGHLSQKVLTITTN